MHTIGKIAAVMLALGAGQAFAWEYEKLIDDFDGAVFHRIRIDSEAGSTPATLTLECREGSAAYWTYRGDEILEGFPSSTGVATSLEMSIDGKPERGAMVSDWPRSDDLMAATTYAQRAVTKRLLDRRRLVIRTVAIVGTTQDAVFEIEGLREALDELAPYCRRI